MEVKQLKVILRLLGVEGYYAPINKVKPTTGTKIPECNRIAYQLRDRGWIELTEKIQTIKITPSGKALLQIEASELPISKKELNILKGCQQGTVKTSGLLKSSPAKERDQLIESLADRGFVQIVEVKPETICLNETGKKFLLEEYSPSGTNSVLSLDMLNNYLTFLRNYQSPSEISPISKPASDDEILQLIIKLDQEYKTNNYLPIFHLREKLQPFLTREEVDQALYRLEASQKIKTSSLVESQIYTPEQINAGIPQASGCPLFFIIVRSTK